MDSTTLDEAYDRLHHAVPEFGGANWLANHGPMVPRCGAPRARLRRPALGRRSSPWVPVLRTAGEFAAAVGGLASVDVLRSHIPPALPELTYDTVARRDEGGSAHLLEVIRRDRPQWALFGHVHQPLAASASIGGTECVNGGHVRRTGTPHVVRW